MADYFERSRDNLRSMAEGVIIDPVVNILVRLRCTPNFVTILGFFTVCVATIFAAQGNFRLSGILVMLSGLMDVYDGALARKLQKDSDKGAFLDSTLDRLGEAVILIGIIYLGSIIGYEKAIAAGLLPFIPSELFKIALAVSLIPTIQKIIKK